MVDINKISCEVGRRKWNCLGHLLRAVKSGVSEKIKTGKAKHVTSSPPVLKEIFVRNSRIGRSGLWGEG